MKNYTKRGRMRENEEAKAKLLSHQNPNKETNKINVKFC